MQAIEFNSQLEHGQLDEDAGEKVGQIGDVWERTAGAWQGAQLVREPQGEYEPRLELE